MLIEELLKTDGEPRSEMHQFSGSKAGKKVMRAGERIKSAGRSINDLAHEQTGTTRSTLASVAEFAYKLGEALAMMNEIDEGSSVSDRLPTVSELRKLHKEIKKLEKL